MVYHPPDIQKKPSVDITSTSDIVVHHQEICIGLDHPLVTQSLESNLAVCREKYDGSKGQCQSKQCTMTIPIIESHTVQEGWRKRVSG